MNTTSNLRLAALALALAVAGCSSVPLDNVPVENKTPTAPAGPTATPTAPIAGSTRFRGS